ncbi:Oxidoreductase [Labilithrix luteola]|uniref:Oxidoreductase n=1 Tax=Labilithrix luteola TaxID=1391654 RepID=A0A0K1PU96_9BACT|nr:NAD(P)H-binding protein [Labilithrix luteola]AKU96699.1 Oxidoreductase [Labilithrix luteola]
MRARAIVIGGTGLVGSQLLDQLQEDTRFEKVVSLVRRKSGREHPKLDEHVIDFRSKDSWSPLIEGSQGDVLFSTLGTTLRLAGSQAAQYEVDYTFQYRIAEQAAAAGVKRYVLVSSSGANWNSSLFYTRMKGELERDVEKLPFSRIRILRPGLLAGERAKRRPLEGVGQVVVSALKFLPGVRQYRPVPAKTVARAMIRAWSEDGADLEIYGPEQVFELGER